MTDAGFKPTEVLAGYLKETNPDQAVKLARELCDQLEGDPDSFHGGVWPGNVELNVDGNAVLGAPNHTPAGQRPADQVEYLAPEHFWDGTGSAAADVYSVGLMLYAGCNGGYLPFQPKGGALTDRDRSAALRSRMKGEKITAPAGVSPELKKVIEKALAYEPESRYITAREFLSALGRTDEALPSAAAVAAAVAGAAAGVSSSAEADAAEAGATEIGAAETGTAETSAAKKPSAPANGPAAADTAWEKAAAIGVAAAAGAAVAVGKAARKRSKSKKRSSGGTHVKNAAPTGDVTSEEGPAPVENAAPEEGPAPAEDAAPEEAPAPAEDAAPEEDAISAEDVTPEEDAVSAEDAAGEEDADSDEEAAAVIAAAGIGAAGAVSAGAAAAGGAHATSGAARHPQYSVQKDFEKKPRAQQRRTAVPSAQRKKKSSKAIPILCGVAAAVLLGSVGYMTGLFRGSPEASDAYTTPEPANEVPSPIVVSPSPSATPGPTNTPAPTKEPAEASPSPSPDTAASAIVPGGGSSETGTVTIGGAGTGTGTGTGTGAGAGTGYGTGTGTGTSAGYGTGTGTGTSAGYGTGTGTSAGYGTGTGTGAGWGTGTGTGTGTSAGTGSGGGFTVDAASGTVYLTGNGVRVRTGPGTSYGIIGAVSTGDSLTRTGTVANGWTQVTYNGVTGYVYSQYLTDASPTATAEPTQAPAPSEAPAPTVTPAPTQPPITASYTPKQEDLSYQEAKAAVTAAGGTMACVADDADFDTITEKLDENGTLTCVWLGAEFDGAAWKWADGTSLPADDAHWAAGDPKTGPCLLLVKNSDGVWEYTSSDGAVGSHAGAIGYVIETTAS